MRYEREFLQQKGIPHLPGDWDFRSEAQQVNLIINNCNSLKRLTAIAYTLC